tara:strand:- start:1209 stop:1508 length:300 start_codon:yes stop_codon:yes gene_type:complete
MAKKDNTLLYMGAAAAGLLLLSKKSVGGIGSLKRYSLYKEEGSDYIHINSTSAASWKNALSFFKTHSLLLINTRAGNKYVIIDEDKVKRLSITDIQYNK